MISGGWGHPCPHQGIPWPGTSCSSTNYSNSEALPVELINFGAVENREQVELSWTTASEVDNELFIIEHSDNGEDFREIGTIEGAGTSVSFQNYSFTHEQPSVGINYYRLQQIDFNGEFEYSNLVSINIKYTGEIQVYPNPTRGEVNFKMSSGLNPTFEVYNQSGNLIQAEKNIGDINSFSLYGLPAGFYIFKFTTSHRTIFHRIYKR